MTTPRPSGLDLSARDTEVRIQDDLFGHVNGAWLRTHTVPADRSTDGAFAALRDLVPLGVEGAIVGKALYAGAFTLAEALDVAGD